MGNCLVTKLNGTVSSSNLPKVGELQIPFKAGTPVELIVKSAVANNATIDKSAFSERLTNSVDFSDSNTTLKYDGTDSCVITIKDKYNLTVLAITTGDVDFYSGLFDYVSYNISGNSLVVIRIKEYSINIDSIIPESATYKRLYLESAEVSGSVNKIYADTTFAAKNSPKLSGSFYRIATNQIVLTNSDVSLSLDSLSALGILMYLVFEGSPNITGDISSLTNPKGLGTLNVKNTTITGSLNTLCDGLYDGGSGKVGGTLNFTGNGIVTYLVDGVATAIPNGTKKTVKFSSSGYTIV